MKKIAYLFFAIFVGLMVWGIVPAKAQCAMCTATVESNSKSGAHATAGLNSGIMYLLAAPYLAVAACGFIWYKKYRRKSEDVALDVPNKKLNLN